VAALAAATCLVVALGCGGGDDESTTAAGPELTHAQVVKQGDAICSQAGAKASRELSAAIKDLPRSQGLDKATEERLVLTINVPAIEGMAADLDALNPPAADQEELQAVVDGFKDATAKIKAEPRAAPPAGPYGKASALAGSFGFQECSKF